MSALAELATAIRKVRRLVDETPERHRPDRRQVFAGLEAAHREILDLTARGRDAEARAIVADFERQAASRVTGRLAHAPLTEDAA